ncbi:sulfonate ABC transporter permease [Methanomicrobiaceae archaeon CYW5]|uniref:ABC transporter permease n=1 Tax=Methanovulcanius yangii TaxID=1789227 RepID=UPI0029CA9CEB|nr:ABC transporter permease [Methanovulcanius yangii]MBT8507970.1 sulfonate ABC transporter permease [Methanovulcanius yangii]
MDNKQKSQLRRILIPLTSVLVVILLWQAVAVYIIDNPFALPSFTQVLDAFYRDLFGPRGTLSTDTVVSLYHFAIGMAVALLVGIPAGVAMGWFKTVDQALNPLVEVLRPIPPLAWIPFAIIWFGLTHASAGFIIFIGAVFPILVNTYTGFRNVPKVFIEAGKVLGCTSSLRQIKNIAFPSAIPEITAGIRISMGVGWMCLVGAEIFGAGTGKYGLGKNLWTYYNLHQMDSVVVYMLVLGFIGLMMDMIFRYYVAKQTVRWQGQEM